MTVATDAKLSRQAIDTIKFLAVDAVEAANSGHPGMPMGMADAAFVLWTRFLRYDPAAPDWPDRDRFVLSAGHGCMLLYSLLHLSGYDLSLDELKNFRQWDSKTPGHPEFGHTVGVEATTGPLGQGISNAVGMAIAAKLAGARFNGGSFDPVGHRVYTICSDGDLMEGVSAEASSLAGHLALGNLIALYDDNHISIEGDTSLAWSEDVPARYEAYGWHVVRVADGHDTQALEAAITEAVGVTDRPSLIACRTHIAHGSPGKQGSASSHGSPLGADEVRATKEAAGWPQEPAFHVPDEVRELFAERAAAGRRLRTDWENGLETWRAEDAARAADWDAVHDRSVPAGFVDDLLAAAPTDAAATRAHGGAVLQIAAEKLPGLIGGSADLSPSNKSDIKSSTSIGPGAFEGRIFHFGVREHAMGAVVNGIGYHGAFRPFGATFLVFADYMRASIRLSALAGLPSIWLFTHDSIFVGEDGPTHEPIEHAWSLRTIPGLHVFRPADGYETALAWGQALERTDGPTALLLTRQKLPPIDRKATGELADPKRGAYLVDGDAAPDAVIAATGSELHLAVAARESLAAEGKRLNVVSIPCLERFLDQPAGYRSNLFPAGVPVCTVEAGITGPWAQLAGLDGLTIGIDRFGASAPASVLAEKFGFTTDSVTARIRDWLG